MGRQIAEIKWYLDQLDTKSTIEEIRDAHAEFMLQHRNMGRLLDSSPYMVAWHKATDKEKITMLKYIVDCDVETLKKLVRLLAFNNVSTADLRVEASRLQIPNYSRISKNMLIGLIENEKAKRAAKTPNP